MRRPTLIPSNPVASNLVRSTVLLASLAGIAAAQPAALAGPRTLATPTQLAPSIQDAVEALRDGPFPFVTLNEQPRLATDYATGVEFELPVQTVWRPVCGTTTGALDSLALLAIADNHAQQFKDPERLLIIDNPVKGAGINIVFQLASSVPAAAIPAFAAAEAYIENQFSDPITVTITCSFAALGSGVLGGTGSAYGSVSYSGSRTGLVNNRDANDTIQTSLPTGTSVPVRYSTNTTTNETRVFWTLANYNSTVGSVAGTAANMQYSNTFPWDFDPSNGVTASAYSFQDVIIHETGHALGFTSGVDFRLNDIETLDLYRFRNTDGNADFNPDTTAEFTARPRWAVFNSPNDDVASDLISNAYRMSDGSPQQASHFRDQTNPIGIMDPTLGFGQTFYPNFYRTSDLTMFDAIGYDR